MRVSPDVELRKGSSPKGGAGGDIAPPQGIQAIECEMLAMERKERGSSASVCAWVFACKS